MPKFVINLNISKENIIKFYKKANELEADADLGEDIEKIEKDYQKVTDFSVFFNDLAFQKHYLDYYNIDANGSQSFILKTVNSIFQKKVICFHLTGESAKNCQIYKKYSDIMCNTCTRYNIAFVDVRKLICEKIKPKCQVIAKQLTGNSIKNQLNSQFKMRWTEAPKDFPSNYTPDIIISLIKEFLNKLVNCPRFLHFLFKKNS